MSNLITHTETFLKALTYRISSTIFTILIAYFITGDHSIAMKIGFFEFFGKLIIYFAHDRVWLYFTNKN
jgi:uncharacterized membrane protein